MRSALQHTRFLHAETQAESACISTKTVSLLTCVRAAKPPAGYVLPSHITPAVMQWWPFGPHPSMLRTSLTLTAPGARGFSPHSIYVRS